MIAVFLLAALLFVGGASALYYSGGTSDVNGVTLTYEDDYCIEENSKIMGDATREQALVAVMAKYEPEVGENSRVIYFIEGYGSDTNVGARSSAMCVVVNDGVIEFVSTNSATIPDQATKHDTVLDTVTRAYPHIQPNVGPALEMYPVSSMEFSLPLNIMKVSNFPDEGSPYNIHKKWCEYVLTPTEAQYNDPENYGYLNVNSGGCFLVGKMTGDDGSFISPEYDRFAYVVGFAKETYTGNDGLLYGNTSYSMPISERNNENCPVVVIDRGYGYEHSTAAKNYLLAKYDNNMNYIETVLGYDPESAITPGDFSITAPSADQALSYGNVVVSWTSSTNAEYYTISLEDVTTGETKFSDIEVGNTLTYTISSTHLTPEHQYRVSVGAVSSTSAEKTAQQNFRMAGIISGGQTGTTYTVGAGGTFSSMDQALAYAGSGDTLVLVSDLNIMHEITIDKTITLKSNGYPHMITAINNTRVVNITSSGTLNMYDDVILTGGYLTSDIGGGVYVANDGIFHMIAGNISGNIAKYYGGGVYVASGGIFVMSGGTIAGNSATYVYQGKSSNGGGVFVEMGGVFTMSGGNISDNTASSHGGGVYSLGLCNISGGNISGNKGCGVYNNGTLFLSGGLITGNTASSYAAGGVYVARSGTLTMSGGHISGNIANYYSGSGGGVYLENGGLFNMTGGYITDNRVIAYYSSDNALGGGVYGQTGSTFNMFGGTITGNTASSEGGGVYLSNGNSFNLLGGNIFNNSARFGAGVYINEGTFTMSDGNISNNKADVGGGVYIPQGAIFAMLGGTISANLNGGGVYVSRGGTLNMSGGCIANNDYYKNYGVYLAEGGTFFMSNSAKVDVGNTVFLENYRCITVIGELESDAGAKNIVPTFNSGTIISYSDVPIPDDWNDNFALNTTWEEEHPSISLEKSGNNLYLQTNPVINYYVDYYPYDMDYPYYIEDSHMVNGTTYWLYETQVTVSGAPLVKPDDPAKTGNLFNSWKIGSPSGTSWNFENDTVIGDTDLYVGWTPITYKVVFDPNGGTGTMSDQILTYDLAESLSPNTFVKDNCQLAGWAETDSGPIKYYDKQSVKNLKAAQGAEVILYAVWTTKITYTLTYNPNGAAGVPPVDTNSPYDSGSLVTVKDQGSLERLGYSFAGWKNEHDWMDTPYAPGSTFTIYDNTILKAVWTPHTYTVKFNSNGGSGAMADQIFTYDQEQNLRRNTFTTGTGVFGGWAETSSGPAKYSDKQIVKNLNTTDGGIITLYATWANSGTISVITDGYLGTVGQTTTIPIVMYGAENITSFEIEVPNTVSGVTMTLNRSKPLDSICSGSTYENQYYPNYYNNRQASLVYWYDSTGTGVTADELHLFSIDVSVTEGAGSPIPVLINVKAIGNYEDGPNVESLYPVHQGSLTISPVSIISDNMMSGAWNAETPAKITYRLHKSQIHSLTAPDVTYAGSAAILNDAVSINVAGVSASVNPDNSITLTGDLSSVENIEIGFIGRTRGDANGDGSVNSKDVTR
ncbi:MAG: InlB B-repeat-containing protein, partial [Candidatus Cloacimonetes bacterium]|nr:InlB B-repeat-containing protein [Candidatus Cloacimonadota bacterium]